MLAHLPPHLHGKGLCLCKGRGLLAKLMAETVARMVCKQAPKDSELRRLLVGNYIVYQFGSSYFHCAMHDFRPKRPTFLVMDLLDGLVWGHQVVKPRYDSKGDAICNTVHEAILGPDLSQPITLNLHRLVTFDGAISTTLLEILSGNPTAS